MEAEVLHKKETLVPKLRFKEFSTAWKKVKIKKLLIEFRLGGNYANESLENGTPLIKMGNLGRGNIVLDKIQYISEGAPLDEKDKINYGDLFFNTRNTLDLVGKVAIWRNELPVAYYNSNLMYIKFEDNFFMNYRFNSFEGLKGLRRLATGTTSVAAIYTKDLLKLSLTTPTIPEQQKIASFLSAVDEKIQQLTRKKELLEQYKKGVMQQLFSGKLRFKDENGKVFPKWEEKRLMDVVESERKIRYGVVQPGEFDENGRLLVRGQDYSQGWVNVNSLFRVSDEVERKYSKARLKFQDLVITIVGAGTGFVAQVPIEFDGANITQTTARIAIDKTKGDPYYFLGYLRSSFGRKLIYSFIKGAAQPGLNVGDVEIFKVKVPCLEEQKKIAGYLSNIDTKIESVTKQITQTQTFKKGLLQHMFV